MKLRFANRSQWARLKASRFAVLQLESDDYVGVATLLYIDQISPPLWVEFDGCPPYCVADNGFTWVQLFPEAAYHTVTAMFDASGRLIQWYIDICKQHGYDEGGIPWFDDLYLDIVVLPSGQTTILDADELEEALAEGNVSQADYELAWRETDRLMSAIHANQFPLLALGKAYREMLLRQLYSAPVPIADTTTGSS